MDILAAVRAEGRLGDIAPTILSAWEEKIPAEMTGDNLLVEKQYAPQTN